MNDDNPEKLLNDGTYRLRLHRNGDVMLYDSGGRAVWHASRDRLLRLTGARTDYTRVSGRVPDRRTPIPVATSAVTDEHIFARPARPLGQEVAYYCGYQLRGVASAVHRGLPSPFLTLTFSLDEPLVMGRHRDAGVTSGSHASLVGGLVTSPVLIDRGKPLSGIQIHLNPMSARALLGLPAGELAGLVIPAEDVLGQRAEEVSEAVCGLQNWSERFAALDRILLRHRSEHPSLPSEVGFAWSLLLRRGGDVRIGELASETGWSERRLVRVMREEIGLTPKRAARVVRFHRTHRMLRRFGVGDMAAMAADLGYTDQAHLTHDFVTLAGLPPTRWLAAEYGLSTRA